MNSKKKSTALQAREIFDSYLIRHKLRRTSERYAIMEAAILQPGFFCADDLYNALSDSDMRVSVATVYNTLDLLSRCSLLMPHKLNGHDRVLYERILPAQTADTRLLLICRRCGKVKRLPAPRLGDIASPARTGTFAADSFCGYIYGCCRSCQRLIKHDNYIKTNNSISQKQ